MKKAILFVLLSTVATSLTFARDTINDFSIEEALSVEKVKDVLGNDIRFYFGDKRPKRVLKNFGEFKSNKKTNAFGKSDKAACQWAFASAMKSLKDRAIREGGNAVINIKSNYKGNLTTSNTTFQCGAGAVMAGVALVGTVVKTR